MARVTVEDCLEKVENRFALVMVAARRTRRILQGEPTLTGEEIDNKEAVTALREIALGTVQPRVMSEEEVMAEIEAQAQADRQREMGMLQRG